MSDNINDIRKLAKEIQLNPESKSNMEKLAGILYQKIEMNKDLKRYILILQDNSTNCIGYESTSRENPFIAPDTKEAYMCENAFLWLKGIPFYLFKQDKVKNVVLELISDNDSLVFKEKLLTASELFATTKSPISKRILPFPKFNLGNLLITALVSIIVFVSTWFACFSIYSAELSRLGG